MFDITIKDSDKFESIIRDLEQISLQIVDVFVAQNKNFSMIDGTDIYRGECQRTISSMYDDTSKNYESIEDALINYIKYLKITIENYKNQEHLLQKGIETNIDNLDVNK